jgi:thiol-disulfide isomerase/thioredoxin
MAHKNRNKPLEDKRTYSNDKPLDKVSKKLRKNLLRVAFVIVIILLISSFVWTEYYYSHQLSNTNVSYSSYPTNTTSKNALIGKPEIDFSLLDTSNVTLSLSMFKNHGLPVFLEFFAPWCPHCIEQGPIVKELYQNYSSKVAFYSVSVPWDNVNYSEVYHFEVSNNYTWFFSLIPSNELSILTNYNVTGVPTIYIINSHGIIKYSYTGTTPYNVLSADLETLQ